MQRSLLSQSVWAAITKHCSLGDLDNRNLFLTVLESRSSRSRCQQGLCLVRVLSLGGKGQVPYWVLTWPFQVHLGGERERKEVLWCLIYNYFNQTLPEGNQFPLEEVHKWEKKIFIFYLTYYCSVFVFFVPLAYVTSMIFKTIIAIWYGLNCVAPSSYNGTLPPSVTRLRVRAFKG